MPIVVVQNISLFDIDVLPNYSETQLRCFPREREISRMRKYSK